MQLNESGGEHKNFCALSTFLDLCEFWGLRQMNGTKIRKPYLQKMGHAVAQLVEALRYKPEDRRFDSRWCHWKFSFRPQYGAGVDAASNRNEYQKYFLGALRRVVRRADNLTYYLHVAIVLKSGSINLLDPSGPVQELL
jgi:hypothetical protein